MSLTLPSIKIPEGYTGPQPCSSCPFLPLNHEEFGQVAERLCKKFKQPKPDFWGRLSIRESVKKDAVGNQRLQCHCTVYDKEMNPHPEESRPCAGLALYLEQHPAKT